MISNWVKVIYLALFLVDLWIMYNLWSVFGSGVHAVLLIAFGVLNLTIGLGIMQMAYLYSFRREMDEEDEEIEVHTFRYTVEKDDNDSKVIQLIDSEKGELAPDLPPVS